MRKRGGAEWLCFGRDEVEMFGNRERRKRGRRRRMDNPGCLEIAGITGRRDRRTIGCKSFGVKEITARPYKDRREQRQGKRSRCDAIAEHL